MRAKSVECETTYINLREKPDWFLEISPHGKVPVLRVGENILFESNAIAEYLDETVEPRLHPADPIARARNRAWTDYVPDFSKALRGVYYTKSREEMDAGLAAAPARLKPVEHALAGRGNDGPFFNGPDFSLVDAAYAPFLQRFAFVDRKLDTGLLSGFPLISRWSKALLADDRVTGAVPSNFEQEFIGNLRRNGYLVGGMFEAAA